MQSPHGTAETQRLGGLRERSQPLSFLQRDETHMTQKRVKSEFSVRIFIGGGP